MAKSKPSPIDPEVFAILDAMLQGWRLVDRDPVTDHVALSNESRDVHEELTPSKELIRAMCRQGLIRDREAADSRSRVCDFPALPRYVTGKGYKLLLSREGLR